MNFYRFGRQVSITATRLIPVWVEKRRTAAPTWHYLQPTNPRHPVEEKLIWHFQGFHLDDGRPVANGRWANAGTLIAEDSSWEAVEKKMEAMNPEAANALEMFNLMGRQHPSRSFPAIDPRSAAT